jgi:outer membrane protein OmpA-like peptidoglycan-associated protein
MGETYYGGAVRRFATVGLWLILMGNLPSVSFAQRAPLTSIPSYPQASKDDWEEINFEYDHAILTDGFPSLLRLAELLSRQPDYKVRLEGHGDQMGTTCTWGSSAPTP